MELEFLMKRPHNIRIEPDQFDYTSLAPHEEWYYHASLVFVFSFDGGPSAMLAGLQPHSKWVRYPAARTAFNAIKHSSSVWGDSIRNRAIGTCSFPFL